MKSRQLLLVGLAIVGCSLLSSCSTTQVNADENYRIAKASFAAHNYRDAYIRLQGPAKAGNADAQYALGYMYFYGKGVVEDKQAATYWFEQAANQGQAAAQRALSLIKQPQPEGQSVQL